jgi:hypothetical protein
MTVKTGITEKTHYKLFKHSNMKTVVKHIVIVAVFMLALSVLTFSQPSTYQNGDGSDVGASATNQGGGGPVSGPLNDGFIPLLVLASVYGAIKYYTYNKEKKKICS